MDLTLALLPWKIIMGIQTRRREKIGIAFAMSMGVFAAAMAFVKSAKLPSIGAGDFTCETPLPSLESLFDCLHHSTHNRIDLTSSLPHRCYRRSLHLGCCGDINDHHGGLHPRVTAPLHRSRTTACIVHPAEPLPQESQQGRRDGDGVVDTWVSPAQQDSQRLAGGGHGYHRGWRRR